jgi:hypothetical protein
MTSQYLTSRRLWFVTAWGTVVDVIKLPHLCLEMPRFYADGYNPERGRPSDRGFVKKRMAHIPDNEKQRVCEEYERIYLAKGSGFRKKANEFLHGEAVKYRDAK